MSIWSRAFGGARKTAPLATTLNVRVAAIREEALNVRSFVLSPASGSTLPPFAPGSHVEVHMKPGLSRMYSIFSDPHDASNYRIAVKLEGTSRGGSRFMHEALSAGDRLEIGHPRNNFPLNEAAAHTLLIAAGIGITPILSMADRLAQKGRSFDLHYFARSPEQAPLRHGLAKAPYSRQVHFHFGLERIAIKDRLVQLLAVPPADSHLYLCGPQGFMDLAKATARATWQQAAVHIERFSADPAASVDPLSSFEVRLARSGGNFFIPADLSILEVLEKQGIEIPSSCRQGVCGSCATGVLQGEPDHRDVFLSAREKASNNQICPCVSRAKSSFLVLDA
ncbi:PDR/VanB family oxidoreductase [Mesorhizobium sp.]|uniref:PDR/VanB family oxidoreductase n=1 Tax=Mesorhizobium sp. TaxID=1871066 RepID=UPI0025E0BDB6|nr:PDR/VanB family oxidoreductase [Mesorhizobium sp.]